MATFRLLELLSLPAEFWGSRLVPPFPGYMVVVTELRTL